MDLDRLCTDRFNIFRGHFGGQVCYQDRNVGAGPQVGNKPHDHGGLPAARFTHQVHKKYSFFFKKSPNFLSITVVRFCNGFVKFYRFHPLPPC